jgi:predicted nucleic acid-binding protein
VSVAVPDASVLVAALIDVGDNGRWAEERVFGHTLAAPHLALVEASNILRRATLAGEIDPREASLAHIDLVELDLGLFSFEPFAPRVWELRDNLTAYDAWHVALAEALGCPLLTLDRRLGRAPGVGCPVHLPD